MSNHQTTEEMIRDLRALSGRGVVSPDDQSQPAEPEGKRLLLDVAERLEALEAENKTLKSEKFKTGNIVLIAPEKTEFELRAEYVEMAKHNTQQLRELGQKIAYMAELNERLRRDYESAKSALDAMRAELTALKAALPKTGDDEPEPILPGKYYWFVMPDGNPVRAKIAILDAHRLDIGGIVVRAHKPAEGMWGEKHIFARHPVTGEPADNNEKGI